MSRKEHLQKAALYDKFQDYIQQKVRSDHENPNLCLKAFELVQSHSATHLTTILENVDNATSTLFRKVEAFRPGTKMKSDESLKDGAPVFTVFIPLGHKSSSSSKKSITSYFSSSASLDEPPSQNMLLVYVILLFVLVIIGFLKTTALEWRMLGLPL